MADGPVGYAIGENGPYSVVIPVDKLETAANKIKKTHPTAEAMKGQLRSAIVPSGAFGDIPGGPEAAKRLADSLDAHQRAMEQMGVSLVDFVARLQAAAQQADQALQATTDAAGGAHHDY